MILHEPKTILSMAKIVTPILLFVALYSNTALAHDHKDHCMAVKKSVADAGFSDAVKVTCENGKALITSNTYPNHPLMTGIVGTNEQVPVPALAGILLSLWNFYGRKKG